MMSGKNISSCVPVLGQFYNCQDMDSIRKGNIRRKRLIDNADVEINTSRWGLEVMIVDDILIK